MKIKLLNYLTVLFLLLSCKKESSNCPASKNAIVNSGRLVIYLGSTLSLSTSIPNVNSLQWSGPGGWSSNLTIPTRANMQPSDAGTYAFKAYDFNNCLTYYGSKNISVVPIPDAPCSIVNNTVSSSSPNIGNFDFPGGCYHSVYRSIFSYTAISSNERIDINFSGSDFPFSGLYETSSNPYFIETPDKVNITITTPNNQQYVSKPGYQLFVNTIGGKQVVTFCSIPMANRFFPDPLQEFHIAGKFTP